jgi:hypothetical protein
MAIEEHVEQLIGDVSAFHSRVRDTQPQPPADAGSGDITGR